MRIVSLFAVALSVAIVAHSAPVPEPAAQNPKHAEVVSGGTTTTAAVYDPVAASLSSKLAAISKGLGKLPILPIPATLKPTPTPVVAKVDTKALVVKNAKATKARRALVLVNNPKGPRQTTTSKVFVTSAKTPIKVPVPTPSPAENPKHSFLPAPPIKVVDYTFTAPGGKTTVVQAQGTWTHPGRPQATTRA